MSRKFKSRGSRQTSPHSSRRWLRPWFLPGTFFFVVFVGLLYLFDARLRPMVMTASSALAHRVGSEALNAALSQDISQFTGSDHLLTTHFQGRDGTLSVTSVNMQELSLLQAEATHDAQERLSELSRQTIRLPIVHLLNGSLLSASTMTIPVRISMLGTVHSTIESDVETKGVNQVVHIISLHVTADIMVITPFVAAPASIDATTPVVYLVMAGPVPNAFYGDSDSGARRSTSKFVPGTGPVVK